MTQSMLMEELLDFVEQRRVVPIIGADLMMVQHGGREVLLQQLIAEKLVDVLEIARDSLPEALTIDDVVASYLDRREPAERIYSRIQFVMNGLDIAPPEPLYKLARIPAFQLFVTTNFDDLLERAVKEVRGNEAQSLIYTGNEQNDLPCPLGELEHSLVYHLFGKVSSLRNAYAVTEEDTLEFMCALQSDGKRPKRLFDALRDRHLLLIGCNFPDWLARFFIRTARCERLSVQTGGMQFMADPHMSEDKNLVLFLRHFSRSTEIFSSSPAQFVDELYAGWMRRQSAGGASSPVGAPQLPMQRGAVFISYASEDRDAALKIRDALESSGLPVWLDVHRLEGGDDYERKIHDHVQACGFFMPIISCHTQTREHRFFRKEWRWSVDRAEGFDDNDPFILPVAIDETTEKADRLPEKFRRVQWMRLPDGAAGAAFIERIVCLFRENQPKGSTS